MSNESTTVPPAGAGAEQFDPQLVTGFSLWHDGGTFYLQMNRAVFALSGNLNRVNAAARPLITLGLSPELLKDFLNVASLAVGDYERISGEIPKVVKFDGRDTQSPEE